MINRNDQYAFTVDFEDELTLDKNGCFTIKAGLLNTDRFTFLLKIKYQSLSKKKQGFISVLDTKHTSIAIENSQYFEAGEIGTRYLNLTGYDLVNKIQIKSKFCKIKNDVKLIGFKNPDFSTGPILIIAPHADDAEIAAYGFYEKYFDNIWITTLNTGDSLGSLKRQYIKNLDDKMQDATFRKTKIRAWNAIATPLLAKIPLSNISALGYFNLTLDDLYKNRMQPLEHNVTPKITPALSRELNSIKLPNDIDNINSGNALISDLKCLIEKVKPSTILVTDPELDCHPEHIVAAHSLAIALKESEHTPENILLYVNHLEGIRNFPYGPEYARTSLSPNTKKSKFFTCQQKCFSHPLTTETQKNKVVAFDSIHDLRSITRLEKTIKQWWDKKIKKSNYHYYSGHKYFQTNIKADEVFLRVDIESFLKINHENA